MKFGIICIECWNEPAAVRFDNCHIYFVGQNIVGIHCEECGHIEYIGEEMHITFPEPDELMSMRSHVKQQRKKRVN